MSIGATHADHHFITLLFQQLLACELQIVEIRGQPVLSKIAAIQITKINDMNLHFVSELMFPVNAQMIMRFRIDILSETIELLGYIQGRQTEQLTNYIYEVNLTIDESTRNKLVFMLNNLARKFMPSYIKAEYYYQYFSAYDFRNSRINLLF